MQAKEVQNSESVWEEFSALAEQNWITQSVRGRGDLRFDGCLRFAGHWTGSIFSEDPNAHVYLLKGARIVGSIRATNVTIEGTLEDGVIEAKNLYAKSGAKIFGQVKVENLILDEGSVIEGRVSHTKPRAPK